MTTHAFNTTLETSRVEGQTKALKAVVAAAAVAAASSNQSQSHPPSSTNSTTAPPVIETSEIVDYFIFNYYNLMISEPEKLHLFYGNQSILTLRYEGELPKECRGPQEIHPAYLSLDLKQSNVDVSTLDYQLSIEDGIMVFVHGKIKRLNNQTPVNFSQFFFLAQQEHGYYVLNDYLRFSSLPVTSASASTEVQSGQGLPTQNVAPVSSPVTNVPSNRSFPLAQTINSSVVESSPKTRPLNTSTAVTRSSSASPGQPHQSEISSESVKISAQPVESNADKKKSHSEISSLSSQPASVVATCKTSDKLDGIGTAHLTSSNSSFEVGSRPLKENSTQKQNSSPTQELSGNMPAASSSSASKPSSWAKLAAAQTEKWGSEIPEVSSSTTVLKVESVAESEQLPPNSSSSSTGKSSSKFAKSQPSKTLMASMNPNGITPAEQKFNTFNVGTSSKLYRSSSSQLGSGSADPNLSVFIKGVRGPLNAQELLPYLEEIGPITYIDVVADKFCAFVNFKEAKDARAAIGKVINVNGMALTIDERKFKQGFSSSKNQERQSSRRAASGNASYSNQ